MWVARDKDGELNLYLAKPVRFNNSNGWAKDCWDTDYEFLTIDTNLFPNLKWEDEPIEVCILDKSELIMENNLFENAYFGKAYKTRSGAKAIFICKRINTSAYSNDRPYVCVVDGYRDIFSYYPDGRLYSLDKFETENDIVSEWEENINEEKLDKIAKDFTPIELSNKGYHIFELMRLSFKAGYRKAKEE